MEIIIENNVPSLILSWQIFFPLRPRQLSEPGRPARRRKRSQPTQEQVQTTGSATCGEIWYLSVAAFPQNPQQLKALGPDVLSALIDVVLRNLNLLTVVHVAGEEVRTCEALLCTNQNRSRLLAPTYNSKPLHWSMMSLSWAWRRQQDKDKAVLFWVPTNHLSFFLNLSLWAT